MTLLTFSYSLVQAHSLNITLLIISSVIRVWMAVLVSSGLSETHTGQAGMHNWGQSNMIWIPVVLSQREKINGWWNSACQLVHTISIHKNIYILHSQVQNIFPSFSIIIRNRANDSAQKLSQIFWRLLAKRAKLQLVSSTKRLYSSFTKTTNPWQYRENPSRC